MKRTIVLDLEFCNVPKNADCSKMLHNEIIEIGAVRLDDSLETVSEYQTYVQPEFGRLTSRIEKLTGISNAMLVNQRNFKECLADFIDWIMDGFDSDTELYICSWSMSDYRQLYKEIQAKHLISDKTELLLSNWRDIQQEFSDGICYNHPLKLSTAISALDADFSGNMHSALADAANTAYIVSLMEDEIYFRERTKGIRSLFGDYEEAKSGNTLGSIFQEMFSQYNFA